MMALQTKCLLAAELQFTLEIRAVRRMAGNTGRHLPVTRIYNTLTDRMAELALTFMAAEANLVAVSFQHGGLV